MSSPQTVAQRPSMRGVLHTWAFVVFLVLGVWLVSAQATKAWPAAVFAASVVGLFGSSALLHRITWSPRWYPRMRRLDHAMIFGLIVGTYTPVFVVGLGDRGVELVFTAVCIIAGAGVLMTLLWPGAPKWLRSGIYVSVGWVGVLAAPDLLDTLGWSGIAMLLGGGVVYSLGAIVYATQRPNPFPGVFGYHEIFHALVIAAVGMHYAVVTFWVY